MKRMNILLVMLLWVASQMQAQLVQENETAVVYYMPKTELVITLSYDRVEQGPGIFYQYAQRYLGAKNIVTEKKTNYHLNDITLCTQASADTDRAYKVHSQKGYNTQLLSLTTDGRLAGYNIGYEVKGDKVKGEKQEAKAEKQEELMPLLEEQFMAGSVAKMAEGAAKQIYRIRETRLNILGGDVEHVPADGQAMQLVLDELDQQEQAIVALFVGTTKVTHHKHTFYYHPADDVEKEVVCRFSKYTGIVDKNDLSGEPIYLTLKAHKQSLQTAYMIDPKATIPSQLYYNLPGTADILLQHQALSISKSITVAQYGVSIPLALDLFKNKQEYSIYIHPETGNILSIKQ
jgi:hypothetical protein